MARDRDESTTSGFWDARAREDALYFVDNRRSYRDPDTAGFWSGGERDLDSLLAALGASIPPDATVLDIGCGVGRLTRVLAERAATVYGIDVSAEMIERARRENAHLDNVHWLHGDGASLAGVADASIDVCVSHVVFQHIANPWITLGYVTEMGRVLRSGGFAAFQVSNDPTIHQSQSHPKTLGNRIAALWGRRPQGQDHPAWLGSAVELDDLRTAADSGRLDVERIEGAGTQFCLVLARRR